MSSASRHRSYGHKGSSSSSSSSSYRNPNKRFVPKPHPSPSSSSSSSSDPPNPTPPHPTLTTSLRASSDASSSSSRSGSKAGRSGGGDGGGGGGNFVAYLPQDEAVASGLGADAGGLDAVESQAVVDLLNDELANLLAMKPRDFWREVVGNDSLHEFLDSYLQFRHRWYDFPHRGARGTVAGVVVGELQLCRRVFMVLYRISSSKDPGAIKSDSLSVKEHTALLQEKKLLDLPKLLDICAIYGHDNGELTRSLVENAIKAQPKLIDNVSTVASHFLSIVHTMHDRCSSSLEVMDFINDAVVTLDYFVDAYRPAALLFSMSFEMSYGVEELLKTLARLHDSLLPSLHQGFTLISRTISSSQKLPSGTLSDIVLSINMLSKRIVKFSWKLLEFSYLNDQSIEDSLLRAVTKMFPANVEDPAIRGEIVIQAFRDIVGEAAYGLQDNLGGGTFLQNLEKDFEMLNRINRLRSNGWIFLDEEQFQYLSQIATPSSKSLNKEPALPLSSLNNELQTDEEAAITESKISQIKDLFPDYGKGFLSACLEVYNQNPEEVIQRILEGTLHEDLLSLDTTLEQIPPRKPAPKSTKDKGKGLLQETASQKDKGKGLLQEGAPQNNIVLSSKIDAKIQGDENGPSSSMLSSSSSSASVYGRYTRKTNEDLSDLAVLDSRTALDAAKTAVLAAEYEYEDEYDDSFDDLGLNIVESAYEESESSDDRKGAYPERASASETEASSNKSNSRWGSQKKTQFYVKDGKNYSYKVSGSVGVSSAQEAAFVNRTQKELIHGLGRGGNVPVGAFGKQLPDEEKDNEVTNDDEGLGRGSSNPRGRGGRRGGGRNHYRKDRAMKKHFAGLGGF
ncbi:Activating signal cointegrator 1 complex subunit 2 [Ananas comosus]|uniref:Activating signal cointegrator 1 complex subunit 2 n=1 Tax=Ananas comosus TaxID=4615 RepID=A0A199VVQ3_ANACO|nr:Activating signal cointegrator 1 complex subunit 2 [Ananas comosus]